MDDELYEGCKTAMYVVTPEGKRLRGADGALFAMKLTGSWFAAFMLLPPFIWLARAAYWLVARNRGFLSKTFFGGVACGMDNRYPEVD